MAINFSVLKKAEAALESGQLPDDWEDISAKISMDAGDYALGVQAVMAAVVMMASVLPEIVTGNRTAKVYDARSASSPGQPLSHDQNGANTSSVHAGPVTEYNRNNVVSAKDVFNVDVGDEHASLPEFTERAGTRTKTAASSPETDEAESEDVMVKRAQMNAAAAETAQKLRQLQTLPVGGHAVQPPAKKLPPNAHQPAPSPQPTPTAATPVALSPMVIAKIMKDWPNIEINDEGTTCSIDLGSTPSATNTLKACAALKLLSGGKEPQLYATTDGTVGVFCG
jgi:hypothetical protein